MTLRPNLRSVSGPDPDVEGFNEESTKHKIGWSPHMGMLSANLK